MAHHSTPSTLTFPSVRDLFRGSLFSSQKLLDALCLASHLCEERVENGKLSRIDHMTLELPPSAPPLKRRRSVRVACSHVAAFLLHHSSDFYYERPLHILLDSLTIKNRIDKSGDRTNQFQVQATVFTYFSNFLWSNIWKNRFLGSYEEKHIGEYYDSILCITYWYETNIGQGYWSTN